MNDFFIAPAIMTGLGLLFAVILAVTHRFLRVAEDPRVEETEDLLPGSNCGACGQPGCHAFAEQLVMGKMQPSQCTVAAKEVVDALAELLDVDPGERTRQVARLHCAGSKAHAHQIAEYHGFDSCLAASVVSGGGKGCTWGCFGLGDCKVVCSFDAITMSDGGLPLVDFDKCTACGDCVDVCPRDLFELVPVDQHLFVQCNAPLAGDLALSVCSVACDACGRCAADAAPGLIRMHKNLPVVDYSAGGPAQAKAVHRCPTGAIQWLDRDQFPEMDSIKARTRTEHNYEQLH